MTSEQLAKFIYDTIREHDTIREQHDTFDCYVGEFQDSVYGTTFDGHIDLVKLSKSIIQKLEAKKEVIKTPSAPRATKLKPKAIKLKDKARGTRLGNTVNLDEAQRKGALTNKVRGQRRSEEFSKILAEALQLGAQTADQIASTLNRSGYSTARGGPWTTSNIYRVLRKLKQSKPQPSTEHP